MIKTFIVYDSLGFPVYSKEIGKTNKEFEPEILSGLISSIGTIGKNLFKK